MNAGRLSQFENLVGETETELERIAQERQQSGEVELHSFVLRRLNLPMQNSSVKDLEVCKVNKKNAGIAKTVFFRQAIAPYQRLNETT